jgi:hypothetical protein
MQAIFIEAGRERIKWDGAYVFFDIGKVWSKKHKRFLKPSPRYSSGHSRRMSNHNYMVLNIKGQRWPLHRLVATLFLPNPDNKPFVCHKDNNVLNNQVSNLYWGSHEDNEYDKIANNTILRGSRNGFAKLTEAQVLSIRQEYQPRLVTMKALGEKYNVDASLINLIIKKRIWKHV